MIDWSRERPVIQAEARLWRLDPDFLEAIRQTENGGPGREFGVLSVSAPGYQSQLMVACHTVAHRLTEFDGNPLAWVFSRIRYRREFVRWFSGIWAPVGAGNDPENLNLNWLTNCWSAYEARIYRPNSAG